MNTAIIVAAGTGSRFGSERPKQFLEILGKPIIQYSLECFDKAPSIDSIIVVVSPDEVENFRAFSRSFRIAKIDRVVAGGVARAESVRNGISALDAACDIVAVHDAARPLVTVDEIERTVAAAVEFGAACLTTPVNDTVKRVDGDTIIATIDRSSLRRAMTPQAFRLEILKAAFAAGDTGVDVTDESSLVERLGTSVRSVPGSSANIKVTRPDDLTIVEAFIRSGYFNRL